MADPVVRKIRAWSGTPVLFRERIVLNTGTPITTSTCDSWSLYVYDVTKRNDEQELVRDETNATEPNDPNDGTVYDTLQTDYLLPDGSGYNFKYVLKPSLFEIEGGKTYRLEFKFVSTEEAETPLYAVWELQTSPILSDSFNA